MSENHIFRCSRCGHTDVLVYDVDTPICACGGYYNEVSQHEEIAIREAQKKTVLRGIKFSEERTARGGSLILPSNDTPDYSLIPMDIKIEYDRIRVSYGEEPRWRHEYGPIYNCGSPFYNGDCNE